MLLLVVLGDMKTHHACFRHPPEKCGATGKLWSFSRTSVLYSGLWTQASEGEIQLTTSRNLGSFGNASVYAYKARIAFHMMIWQLNVRSYVQCKQLTESQCLLSLPPFFLHPIWPAATPAWCHRCMWHPLHPLHPLPACWCEGTLQQPAPTWLVGKLLRRTGSYDGHSCAEKPGRLPWTFENKNLMVWRSATAVLFEWWLSMSLAAAPLSWLDQARAPGSYQHHPSLGRRELAVCLCAEGLWKLLDSVSILCQSDSL